MERTALAVIGAGYGDEGKGLVTDAVASRADSVVVRTNGGAQAGHTVATPDGGRHVFHHVPSGALAGARSHLSAFFVSNPMLLHGELAELAALGGETALTADPRGMATTPYDMMLNRAAEATRGGGRHGSCGVGFGETVERHEASALTTTLSELRGPGLRARLDAIRREWVPARAAALGLDLAHPEFAHLMSDAVLDRFVGDAAWFSEAVAPMRDRDLRMTGRTVVLEGAQGLMLDMDRGAFPFVTRSNTGLRNMAAVAAEAGFDGIDVTYATRAYVTRHGAGPLSWEVDALGFADVVDPTNVPNDWQGTIRYAPLDLDILAAAVAGDVEVGRASGLTVVPRLAVTCLDQIPGDAVLVSGGRRSAASPEALAALAGEAVGAASVAGSHGPTRATLVPVR